jgi:hypothetical protein
MEEQKEKSEEREKQITLPDGTSYRYEILPDQTVRLNACTGGQNRIELPDQIEGYKVSRLGRHLFYEDGLLVEEVILPDSIHFIEDEALEFTICLQKVCLNSGLIYIGKNAFNATQLTELTIPNTVAWMEEPGEWGIDLRLEDGNSNYSDDGFGIYYIGKDGKKYLAAVHAMDQRKSYRLADDCHGILKHALLSDRQLKELILPKSVQKIAEGALTVEKGDDWYEDSLAEEAKGGQLRLQVRLEEGNPVLSIQEGCLLENRTLTKEEPQDNVIGREDRVPWQNTRKIPSAVSARTYTALYGNPGFTGDLVRLSHDLDAPLTAVGAEAFYGCDISEIRLPLSLKRIGAEAFLDCRLKKACLEEKEGWTEIPFPSEYGYLMNRLLESFGKNSYRYDYSTYDANLLNGSWNREKLRMAVSRLKQGRHLKADIKKSIEDRISADMEEILKLLSDQHDGETLEELAALHFFTEENTDKAIAYLNRSSSKELLPILLNIKRSQKKTTFDFSL